MSSRHSFTGHRHHWAPTPRRDPSISEATRSHLQHRSRHSRRPICTSRGTYGGPASGHRVGQVRHGPKTGSPVLGGRKARGSRRSQPGICFHRVHPAAVKTARDALEGTRSRHTAGHGCVILPAQQTVYQWRRACYCAVNVSVRPMSRLRRQSLDLVCEAYQQNHLDGLVSNLSEHPLAKRTWANTHSDGLYRPCHSPGLAAVRRHPGS